ncbi:helix-turn-helix transcriptional regulator [Pararobbsia alpina]|uniref:HTH cro/C1-type domain-containing protein n=1 Tax=Pararobbsia alpina TaxID=621374 RepID=A0A6S7B6C2_9BURK|nr:helix-turn-helix transcriptional regulator [Pararobbsia alpina]CAB3788728.1 hypothetical protein LMG28138_02667 [Pararobbsia alpina]
MDITNLDKASDQRPKSSKQPLPLPVQRALRKLGNDLALARRRRHMTQASVAERIGASRPTIQRMEQGDPRVPIHFIARAMYLFGEIDAINELMDTARDDIGLTLMDAQLPQRVRNRKKGSAPSGAL